MKQLIFTIILVLCLTAINAQTTQFSSISAVRNANCTVTLSFTTSTEYASGSIYIDRSKDGGVSYIEIGSTSGNQAGNGFAGSGRSYTWIDMTPFNGGLSGSGVYHYRVRTRKYDTYRPWYNSGSTSVPNNNSCGMSTTNTLCTGTPYYWGYGFTPGWGGPTTTCSVPVVPIEIQGVRTQTIVWNSTNPSVATVGSDNFLVPLAAGYTNISASLPACGMTLPPVRFDICPCNGHTTPYGLGGNWSGGVCQLWFSRLGTITTYNLQYVNLNTGSTGNQTINYTTSTYPFSGLPAMTPFKWRVAATVAGTCTGTDYSDWNYVVQSGTCTSTPVNTATMVASCVCGATCAGSCGYERFNWTALPNMYTYEVTYEVFRISPATVMPQQTFTISSNPPTVWPIANYSTLTGPGWQIRFKVRAQCVDGTWQNYSGWSPNYAL